MINKLMKSKLWWFYIIVAVIAVNWIASVLHYRLDLTTEKRYTLSNPTKRLLNSLNDRVLIDVFRPATFPPISATLEITQKNYYRSSEKMAIIISSFVSTGPDRE